MLRTNGVREQVGNRENSHLCKKSKLRAIHYLTEKMRKQKDIEEKVQCSEELIAFSEPNWTDKLLVLVALHLKIILAASVVQKVGMLPDISDY